MRPVSSAFAILVTLGAAGSAFAGGGYVALGVGSQAQLGGTLDTQFSSQNHGSGRIALGQRIDQFAVEASLSGADLKGQTQFVSQQDYSTKTLGVDLKYFMGLAGPLEGYVKGGVNKTWLEAPAVRSTHSYDGTGWDVGAGLQLGFDLPMAAAALWLDYTRLSTDLRDGTKRPLDGTMSMMTIGVTVGF